MRDSLGKASAAHARGAESELQDPQEKERPTPEGCPLGIQENKRDTHHHHHHHYYQQQKLMKCAFRQDETDIRDSAYVKLHRCRQRHTLSALENLLDI